MSFRNRPAVSFLGKSRIGHVNLLLRRIEGRLITKIPEKLIKTCFQIIRK